MLIPSDPQLDHWLRRELREGGLDEEKQNEFDSKLVEIAKDVYAEYQQVINGIYIDI